MELEQKIDIAFFVVVVDIIEPIETCNESRICTTKKNEMIGKTDKGRVNENKIETNWI